MSTEPILITGVGKRIGLDEFQRAVDYLLESQYVTGRIHYLAGGRHLKP